MRSSPGRLLLVCFATIMVNLACGGPTPGFKEQYEHFYKVQVGWTEQMVREHLGEPLKAYDRETAPAHYYLKGYGYKKRPITNKVWIYENVEPVAYIYFDQNDRVEEVVVRGS